MTSINLLPWREKQREEQAREFYVVLAGAAIISILLIFMVFSTMKIKVNNQRDLNELYRQEIATLEQQIQEIKDYKEQKERLLARMNIIQELQANRSLIVRFFDALVRILPDGVFLTEVQKQGREITLTGRAESNTRVSELMRNIEGSNWVSAPILTEIKTDEMEGERIRVFKLAMQVKSASEVRELMDQENGSE